MKILDYKIDCPECHTHIHVPFLEELKAESISNWDLNEISAQEELSNLRGWLASANLWTFIIYWWKNKVLRRINE